jgi:predicted XRE-type DNA-binding protein
MDEERDCTVEGGNVFADLGLPEPEARLAKAKLARQIGLIIGENGWTQEQAARELGVDQPTISRLLRGRLSGISTDRLMEWLNRLNRDVTITVSQSESPKGRGSIVVVDSGVLPMAASERRGNGRKMIF